MKLIPDGHAEVSFQTGFKGQDVVLVALCRMQKGIETEMRKRIKGIPHSD